MNTLPNRKEIESIASAKCPKTQQKNPDDCSTIAIATRAILRAANIGKKSAMIPLCFTQQANDPTPRQFLNLMWELRNAGYSFDEISEHNVDSGITFHKLRVYILPRDY